MASYKNGQYISTHKGNISLSDMNKMFSEGESYTAVVLPTHVPVPVPVVTEDGIRRVRYMASFFRIRRAFRCPDCGHKVIWMVEGHPNYRDPFLECAACKSTYRLDKTPLDLTFAWRDGIKMPFEVLNPDEKCL